MTNLMIQLRRSPRTLLERDGHPGPGPGHLAVVMARAGVGKTAFLVGIGIDALLSGQKVLHISLERTVEKVRDWYDDLLKEMLRREKKLEHWTAIQLEIEKRRNIHTYVGRSFSADRMREALDLLREAMDFVPNVIILDRMELEGFDPATIEAAKARVGRSRRRAVDGLPHVARRAGFQGPPAATCRSVSRIWWTPPFSSFRRTPRSASTWPRTATRCWTRTSMWCSIRERCCWKRALERNGSIPQFSVLSFEF